MGLNTKTISIMTPCFNEEANVFSVYNQVREVMARIGRYEYEHIFIDNSSTGQYRRHPEGDRGGRQECQDHRQLAKLRPHPLSDACASSSAAAMLSSVLSPTYRTRRR